MADVIRGKRHVVVFTTERGEMAIATDDIEELAQQQFFREFMGLSRPVRYERPEPEPERPVVRQAPVQPVQQPPQQRQSPMQRRPAQTDFLQVTPDQMTQQVWESLTAQQRELYMQNWNVQ